MVGYSPVLVPGTQSEQVAGMRKVAVIVGMSHTTAIRSAAKVFGSPVALNVINPNLEDSKHHMKDGVLMPSLMDVCKGNAVFSMLGGNYHNVFGLIEHPVKFDFCAYDNDSELSDDRTFIPYNLMRALFSKRLSVVLDNITRLGEMGGVSIHHVCSPPPIFNSEHIKEHPGVFREKLHLGISPPGIRMKLYNLQTSIFRDYCSINNIGFIPPPVQALDENGFLRECYWCHDPTHGNKDYGRLVLEQMLETMG